MGTNVKRSVALRAVKDETDDEQTLFTDVSFRANLVGQCIADDHPQQLKRVRVRWLADGDEQEAWVPTLRRLAVRRGDQVLLSRPANWPEPIVVGVLDGFPRRDELERVEAARIDLRSDEAVRVAGVNGAPLLELFESEEGPVVRLLQEDTQLELAGALRISAREIALSAREGPIEIDTPDEVIVKGENIYLN